MQRYEELYIPKIRPMWDGYVIAFALAKMGFISSKMLSEYRKHAFIIIMLVAAIITPPDLMTLILVTVPLYMLFEISIKVVRLVE